MQLYIRQSITLFSSNYVCWKSLQGYNLDNTFLFFSSITCQFAECFVTLVNTFWDISVKPPILTWIAEFMHSLVLAFRCDTCVTLSVWTVLGVVVYPRYMPVDRPCSKHPCSTSWIPQSFCILLVFCDLYTKYRWTMYIHVYMTCIDISFQ